MPKCQTLMASFIKGMQVKGNAACVLLIRWKFTFVGSRCSKLNAQGKGQVALGVICICGPLNGVPISVADSVNAACNS